MRIGFGTANAVLASRIESITYEYMMMEFSM